MSSEISHPSDGSEGTAHTSEQRDIAIQLTGVSRAFGATQALSEIDLEVKRGMVHALVGENGAGKSTCLGIIAGRIQQDTGSLRVFGKLLDHNSPRRARAAGVVSVYQELTIVPELTTQANVFLGQALSRGGVMQERAMRRRYVQLCQELDVASHPDVGAGTLSVADQQLIEIMRALVSDPQIILLDEPTASLAPHERTVLLRLLDVLRRRGIAIVLVSHNLEEVLEIADVITVFRGGHLVKEAKRQSITKDEIVGAMLGRALNASPEPRRTQPQDDALLKIEGLSVPHAISDISFTLASGEILGLGGLVGSGRTSILHALAGASPRATGRLWMDGEEHSWPTTPRQGRALKIALLPEDRKTEGLVGVMSAADNIIMSNFSAAASSGFLFRRQLKDSAVKASENFGIDVNRLLQPAENLSGGNQQKLLLARWAHSQPRILLADEPTRGIDIGAKQEILAHLRRLADRGMSIVIVSSELEEVVAVSDRILVLAEGKAVGMLEATDASIDEHDILRTIFQTEVGGS